MWDEAVVPMPQVERRLLPEADVWRLPDRHRRPAEIGPATDWRLTDSNVGKVALRSLGTPHAKPDRHTLQYIFAHSIAAGEARS